MGANGYDTDASESSMSELSNGDSSTDSRSRSRLNFGRTRKLKKKKKERDSRNRTASAQTTNVSRRGSAERSSRRSSSDSVATTSSETSNSNRSMQSTSSSSPMLKSPEVEKKRLTKDAKSRFNIGIVYMKTGDFTKAQENLEHSLFCYFQLMGRAAGAYSNAEIFAIAGVREKLGDCYFENTSIVDKQLALDNYNDSLNLLKSVHPEDAPPDILEMVRRVEEKEKQLEFRNMVARGAPSSRFLVANRNSRNQNGGVGDAAAAATVGNVKGNHNSSPSHKCKTALFVNSIVTGFDQIDVLGVGKGLEKVQDFAYGVVDGVMDIVDFSDDDASRKSFLSEKVDWFETAMSHLERDNHRTALNYLRSIQEGGSMESPDFRNQMADSMMKVAASALEAEKISVASDAYAEAHAALKQGDDAAPQREEANGSMKLATKGCIKSNKLIAKEMEAVQNYDSAILHRKKVYQFLVEENRTIPACQQQVRIAFLHGENENYEKSTSVLSEAIGRLRKGVKSVDNLASDGKDLLIECHQMQAVCYAKSKKWNDALMQYEEALSFVSKKGGQGSKHYNSLLIRKSALLVTMGNHRLAAQSINKYLQTAEFANQNLIVDALEHALALDIAAAAHLKMGHTDKAISTFQSKLAFVKNLPNNAGMTSDTMHKLGCLLANDSEHKKALPMLNEALRTKKTVYDAKHKSVLETTWAVAATNHALGDNDKALKEYTVLMNKMANDDDMPVDAAIIRHSAGKLLVEDGKVDKAVQSFRQALKATANPQLKSEIRLNMANALSAAGDVDTALETYDDLLRTKSLKKTKTFFLARFNKSLLLIKLGEVEEAKEILHKIEQNRSSMAKDLRGSIFLTLGNLSVSDGNIDEALEYFDDALDETKDDDLSALACTKRSIAMAQLNARQTSKAISTLEGILEDLSYSDMEGKSVNLLTAEIWNCLSRVYKEIGDLHQAKNFAKLALQTYKTELGKTNPITLRNVSNLQLLRLEEAEGLEKSEAKSIIDASKYELEETLEAFMSLDDLWIHRLDVTSLKANLGFVAVWQEKTKKARKLVSQIKDIELPPDHPLENRIAVLEERVEELEKKHGIASGRKSRAKRR